MERRTARTGGAALRWLAVYVAAVTLPLFALLPGETAPPRGFAWDFSIALGYAGLAMLGVLFALTARFKRATAPFGIDVVYVFHRDLALLAVAIVFAHYVILRVANPAALGSADPRVATPAMTAGRVALVLFVAVALLSLLRRALRHDYDAWRGGHALLSTLAYALALVHLFGAARLLDTAWKQALWAAYGLFWLALIGWVRIARPWRLARRPWRVAEVRAERGAVHTLVLDAPPGERLRFAPGQFAWLSLGASPWAMREHPFSIASAAPDGGSARIELSIKALGDFSAAIADVRPGATAYVDAPYGSFGIATRPAAPGYLFVAGGIGIAPVMSMLRTLALRADRRPLVLVYGNRVWERIAFREELDALAAQLPLRVVHVLLEPPPDWGGARGFVERDVLAPQVAQLPAGFECFLCGPTAMTRGAERALAALGVPDRRVHSELFEWV